MRAPIFDFRSDIARASGVACMIGARLIGIPMAAAALAVLAAAGRLPAPRALENMEEAVLTAKAELARRNEPARWVAIGDSACLMNFDARLLSAHTGETAVNLGTWSDLTFDAYAALLRARTEAGHPAERVLLILHPGTLKRSASNMRARALLESLLRAQPRPRSGVWAPLKRAQDRARDSVVNRLVPRPLPAAYGARHGTTQRLFRDLIAMRGFLPAPETASAHARGRPDFHLAPRLAEALAAFRAAAGDADIMIALSPIPRSELLMNTKDDVADLRAALTRLLQPARALDLPIAWEDADFYDRIHLRARGQAAWQERVHEELSRAAAER